MIKTRFSMDNYVGKIETAKPMEEMKERFSMRKEDRQKLFGNSKRRSWSLFRFKR